VPSVVLDVVSVAMLVVMLAVAFRHPSGRTEAVTAIGATAVVLVIGAVGRDEAWRQVRLMLPVVLFLVAILVVARICAADGLFAALGARVRGRDPQRALVLAFTLAAVVTAALSLDATVVLLTPVLVVAAAGTSLERPLVHTCVRLANSASLLLPVSNLTNLLALPHVDLTFVEWAAVMAPVWVSVILVEYAGVRLIFRADLRQAPAERRDPPALPRFTASVVLMMLAGFAVVSPFGVDPWYVAALAAVVLSAHAVRRRSAAPREIIASAQLPFALFVLALAVVVRAVSDAFVGRAVRDVMPHGTGLGALLLIALVCTVTANLVNNLPATLLVLPVVSPLGTTAVLAALVGLGVGSGLTYPGSLANLLWRRTLTGLGHRPSAVTFHVHAALVTPVALVVGTAVLWAVRGG
jgi:arsenical pump membrane protein